MSIRYVMEVYGAYEKFHNKAYAVTKKEMYTATPYIFNKVTSRARPGLTI
jgi:hypothetical protein